MTGRYFGSSTWTVDGALVKLMIASFDPDPSAQHTVPQVGYGVGGACIAFRDGEISEDELIEFLVALAPVKQAPLPDEAWYDAIIRYHGPVSAVGSAFDAGLLPDGLHDRAVRAMFDAGHGA
jgi:hypothetical protein